MNLFYKLTFWDDKGMIKETPLIQSKSFLKAFIWYLNATFNSGVSSSSILNVVGTLRIIFGNLEDIGILCWHPGGDSRQKYENYTYGHYVADSVGIITGTGTNAITVDDYVLQTPIIHGTSAGRLEYLSCAVTNLIVTGTTYSFDLQRIFKNSSGNTINISELGIYSVCYSYTTNYFSDVFMIVRDLVSPTQAITDGTYMKVTYTFQIT